MRALLDTVTFIWLVQGDGRLSDRALKTIRSPETELYLSVVSVWEIVIKHALGKLVLRQPPDTLIPEQREALAVDSLPLDEHAVLTLGRLPRLHADPFDRMLVAQAIAEGLVMLTPDAVLRRYPVRSEW